MYQSLPKKSRSKWPSGVAYALALAVLLLLFWGIGYASFPHASKPISYGDWVLERQRAALLEKVDVLLEGTAGMEAILEAPGGLTKLSSRLTELDRTFRDASRALEEMSPPVALEGYVLRVKGLLERLGNAMSSLSLYIAAQEEDRAGLYGPLASELAAIRAELEEIRRALLPER
ncbi:MAG: hypothetical protein ACPL7G_11740 [Chloroflexia bacterium]